MINVKKEKEIQEKANIEMFFEMCKLVSVPLRGLNGKNSLERLKHGETSLALQ